MGYSMPCICHGGDGLTHGLMDRVYRGKEGGMKGDANGFSIAKEVS